MIVTTADFANLSLIVSRGTLCRRLRGATVVLSDEAPPELVTMNSQVTLRDEATGERRVVSVVYPADADREVGRISVLEAAGTALLGSVSGQVIELQLAGGVQRVRVQEVIYQPERSLRAHMVVRS